MDYLWNRLKIILPICLMVSILLLTKHYKTNEAEQHQYNTHHSPISAFAPVAQPSADQIASKRGEKDRQEAVDKAVDRALQRADNLAQVDMTLYALIGLIVGVLGIGLIGATLKYTRDAAGAASDTLSIARDTFEETRENSRRELRAYLSVQNVLIMGKAATPVGGNETCIQFDVVNSGQTPAYNVTISIQAMGVAPEIDTIVLNESAISAGGFSQIHKGIIGKAEYEGTAIDFDKMVIDVTEYTLGEATDTRKYVPNAKVNLLIILQYFDAFSVESGDDTLKFRDVFLYSQHLPTVSSEMWAEAITENNKQIT